MRSLTSTDLGKGFMRNLRISSFKSHHERVRNARTFGSDVLTASAYSNFWIRKAWVNAAARLGRLLLPAITVSMGSRMHLVKETVKRKDRQQLVVKQIAGINVLSSKRFPLL